MAAESLPFSNASLPDPEAFSKAVGLRCIFVAPGSLTFITFTVTLLLLLLPLCVHVLYCAVQQWRLQRSPSHADSFTYHLVAMELCSAFGNVLCCCGIYSNDFQMVYAWYYPYLFAWFGKVFFHNLTCLEHYLAVVHPITYLSLKKERAIRIRNGVIGCIWLLCFGWTFTLGTKKSFTIINMCVMSLSLVIISFCSLSVLYALIRPGPGEQGGDGLRVHQSKQRAFYTIVAILGVLLFRCLWNLVWTVGDVTYKSTIVDCLGISCEIWFNFPSTLVLPLLFLQRTRTVTCCKTTVE